MPPPVGDNPPAGPANAVDDLREEDLARRLPLLQPRLTDPGVDRPRLAGSAEQEVLGLETWTIRDQQHPDRSRREEDREAQNPPYQPQSRTPRQS